MQKILSIIVFCIASIVSQAQDPYFTTPGDYGQTYIHYQPSENIMYSGTSRFGITSTADPANVSLLVNGKYNETAVTVPAGQSATITIDFQAKGGSHIQNPEGSFSLNFFDEYYPDSVSAIIYDSASGSTGIEYDDWINVSSTSPYILLRGHVPSWFAGLKKIEIRIKSRSSVATKLSEVDYVLARPGEIESGLVTKWANNTLWSNLYIRDGSNQLKASIKTTGTAEFNELRVGDISSIDTVTKLLVGGGLFARLIKVNQDNWADYVFHAQYKLPALKQVKSFIGKNQHLPGVPSAAAIKKMGLDLGAMQKIMMEKIEELTLYVIKQDEKIQLLNGQLKKLEKKQNGRN
ncbi:MAG: hypothetical protein ABI675_02690 [Chitinophagaceae bacterium]